MNPANKRLLLWTAIGIALIILRGPAFIASFRPPPDFLGDFAQDWVSARNFRDARPVYEPTRVAFSRISGTDETENTHILPRNAHPPAAVLVTLPFGSLDHQDAQFTWTLITFSLFVAGIAAIMAELGGRAAARWAIPAVGLAMFCHSLVLQLQLGNFNCLLAALLAGTWVAGRHKLAVLAGVLAGVAAAVKLTPAILLLWFAFSRQWRGAIAMAVAFIVLNGAALALFGIESFRTYATDIVPATEAENLGSWLNASAAGFWTRLFGPTAGKGIIPVLDSPAIGRVLIVLTQLSVAGIVLAVSYRSRTVDALDRSFALTCVGMMLIGPLSWPHSFLMLAPAAGILAVRLPPGGPRNLLLACLALLLWMPANYVAQIALGPEQAILMMTDQQKPLTPAENLIATGPQFFALVMLFVLCLRLPRDNS